MDDDCIQESGSYREETNSDHISGLTNEDDAEQESEMATTSQVVVPEIPRRTPIVYEPVSQLDMDKPLDYHVQRTKELNMKNVAEKATQNRRMDTQREEYRRNNQRTDYRRIPTYRNDTQQKSGNPFGEGSAKDKKIQRSQQRYVSYHQ